MSPWRRALVGVALGSLLVLMLHPASRPFFWGYLRLGDSRWLATTALLPEGVTLVEEPTSLEDAAYVLLIAAEAELRGEKLTAEDWRRLSRIATEWQRKDPDNGFWLQMNSLFLARLGQTAPSDQAWIAASRAARWDDYQTARLRRVAEGLQAESGAALAWQWGYLYRRRSNAIPLLLLRHARALRDRSPVDSPQGLEIRYATLLNGVLIRDGARSNLTGQLGVEMVELASYPAKLAIEVSQKKLLLARQAFSNRLREEGRPEEANRVDVGFRDNDAWIALVRPEEAPKRAQQLTWLALFSSSTAGIALLLAGFGAAIALLGWAIERSPRLQVVFSSPVAPVVGLVLAILTYLGTELVFPSLWAVLCLTFFAFAPEHTRKIEPRDLGPMFRFTLLVLGAALSGLLVWFFLGLGAPGVRLLPLLGVPREYGTGSTLVLGLSGILFGMVLLTAPAWGIVQRFAPPRLAGLAMRELGIGILVASIAIAMIAGPIAITADSGLEGELSQLAQNEPLYSQNTNFDQ